MAKNGTSEDTVVDDGWEVQSLKSDDGHNNTKESSEKDNTSSSSSSKKRLTSGSRKKRKRSHDTIEGAGHSLTRSLWRVFSHPGSTPFGGRVTPEDSGPASPKKAFGRSSKRTDDLIMKTISDYGNRTTSLNNSTRSLKTEDSDRNVSHYSNPSYIPSYLDDNDLSSNSLRSRNRHSYQAQIYSVNSAGNPVPITIEESENEDDGVQFSDYEKSPDSVTDDAAQQQSSPDQTASRNCGKNGCCFGLVSETTSSKVCGLFRPIWFTTYRPDSGAVFYWLLVVTICYLYNLWTIPLRATFYEEVQSSWKDVWFSFDGLCDLIFIVDIFIRFRTSFIHGGVFISDITQLNRYHRREWGLVFDILAIFPTDLFFLQTINPYLRLNRLLKLPRVIKFYQIAEVSTWSPNFWRSLNVVHLIAVIIHYNACFYYGLSSFHGFGQLLSSWSYPNPKFFPEYTTTYRRYTYSFYWCMIGLGFIGDRYLPENDWQFVFSIYLSIVGVIIMVFLVGFATASLLGKGIPRLEFERAMKSTRAYMTQRKLPKHLRKRILQFYQYCWTESQFQNLDETNMFRYLPESVREEIELHSSFNALKQIPSLTRCDSNILKELVMKLRRCFYLPGQFVYRSGDQESDMYIVSEGILQVVRDGDPTIYTLSDGDFFGDFDFLSVTNKRRTADVVSYGYSKLCVLSVKDVMEILSKHPKFLDLIQQQERRRQTLLNNLTSRECRAYGGKYQALSTSTVKSQADSRISASKVHFQMSNGDIRHISSRFDANRDVSPDSCIPSSPSVGLSSNNDTPCTFNSTFIKPEISEKISIVYKEHMKSLKIALDNVLFQEISYLQQRLDDTEQERDVKAREISHLRRQLARWNDGKSGTGVQSDSLFKTAYNSNNKENSEDKVTVKNLVSEGESVKSTEPLEKTVIKTVRKKNSSSDVFGSEASLGKA